MGAKGILKVPDPANYDRLVDTFVERLLSEDVDKWKLAKAGGIRDARLVDLETGGPVKPLFRDAAARFKKAAPPDPTPKQTWRR